MKKIDMTGWKMNEHGVPNSRWTVLHEGQFKGHQRYWVCQCECGTIKEVQGGHLRDGSSVSCGCINKERILEYNHAKHIPIPAGTRFGLLTVLEDAGTQFEECSQRLQGVSLCQCDCGSAPRLYFNYRLKNGNTKSCGCLRSWGETCIARILDENNIQYQREYTFEDCRNEKGNKYRFDFAIFEDNKLSYLIEMDGRQHVEGGKNNWGYSLEEARYSDKMKNQYCLDHNILLKRIPHYDVNKISIEKIQSDIYNCYPVSIEEIIADCEEKYRN